MCKHVAAAMYGVGARLDEQPELLFRLRQVDHLDLVARAGDVEALTRGTGREQTLSEGDLGEVFGIELDTAAPVDMPTAVKVNQVKIKQVKAAEKKSSLKKSSKADRSKARLPVKKVKKPVKRKTGRKPAVN